MFTKLVQRSWIKIKVTRGRSTQECFQELREACGGARVKNVREGKGCRSGQSPYRMIQRGEQYSSTP